MERGGVHFCGTCAISADWQHLIATIQDARVDTPVAGGEVAQSA
ncbi:MAG: hypothetical protein V3V29_01335 [Acidimicrobiia bacterium]